MISEAENQRLTRVGPGTPMGGLLRRYWQPIAAAAELDEAPTKPIRLLGEDLVLFKDGGGRVGLVQRACAHRGTDLALGIVEDYGLRCGFHGWLYGLDGRCLDQPLEPEPFCDQVRLRSYAVELKAGLVWAYLGPEPAPLVLDWEAFGWQDGLVQIVFAELPCNWLQCQEPAFDSTDLATLLATGAAPTRDRLAGRLSSQEFEYGFALRKQEDGQTTVGENVRTVLWPNGVFIGNERACRFEWRVPIDHESTLSVAWFFDRIGQGQTLAPEERVFYWRSPLRDEASGELITTHALNHQFAIWINQGRILDRTKEFLVDSDWGVVMLRSKYMSQMDLIADGGEPKGLIRDPDQNRHLRLPLGRADPLADLSSSSGDFPYLAGQPAAAAAVYERVKRGRRPPARQRRR